MGCKVYLYVTRRNKARANKGIETAFAAVSQSRSTDRRNKARANKGIETHITLNPLSFRAVMSQQGPRKQGHRNSNRSGTMVHLLRRNKARANKGIETSSMVALRMATCRNKARANKGIETVYPSLLCVTLETSQQGPRKQGHRNFGFVIHRQNRYVATRPAQTRA